MAPLAAAVAYAETFLLVVPLGYLHTLALTRFTRGLLARPAGGAIP
jgi:hypothetical protein